MNIVPRAEWGARYEDGFGSAPIPAAEVWLHHSVTIAPDLVPPFDDEYAAMRSLESIGESRFGRGISYTFGAMPTGRLYEGHGIARQGAHTGGRNSIARAIVLVGNHEVSPVTDPQIEAIAGLLVHGFRSGWWRAARLAGGHQQAPGASTACPGRHGMAAIPRINERAAAILAGAPIEGDDVQLTDRITFRRPDTGVVVSFSVGEALAYATYYAGEAATKGPAKSAAAVWATKVQRAGADGNVRGINALQELADTKSGVIRLEGAGDEEPVALGEPEPVAGRRHAAAEPLTADDYDVNAGEFVVDLDDVIARAEG